MISWFFEEGEKNLLKLKVQNYLRGVGVLGEAPDGINLSHNIKK